MFVVEVMLELLRWHQLKTLAANPSIFAVRMLSCEMVVQEESLKLTHSVFKQKQMIKVALLFFSIFKVKKYLTNKK